MLRKMNICKTIKKGNEQKWFFRLKMEPLLLKAILKNKKDKSFNKRNVFHDDNERQSTERDLKS